MFTWQNFETWYGLYGALALLAYLGLLLVWWIVELVVETNTPWWQQGIRLHAPSFLLVAIFAITLSVVGALGSWDANVMRQGLIVAATALGIASCSTMGRPTPIVLSIAVIAIGVADISSHWLALAIADMAVFITAIFAIVPNQLAEEWGRVTPQVAKALLSSEEYAQYERMRGHG